MCSPLNVHDSNNRNIFLLHLHHPVVPEPTFTCEKDPHPTRIDLTNPSSPRMFKQKRSLFDSHVLHPTKPPVRGVHVEQTVACTMQAWLRHGLGLTTCAARGCCSARSLENPRGGLGVHCSGSSSLLAPCFPNLLQSLDTLGSGGCGVLVVGAFVSMLAQGLEKGSGSVI